MNRAQRRSNNSSVEMYTEERVRAIVRKSNKEVLQQIANDYLHVMSYTIRNKLKYGHKRMDRFLAQMNETFNDVECGNISIEDMRKVLKDEIGVIIK